MRQLLIICQKVDEADDLLGFFTAWIARFAEHAERVDVIALGEGKHELPANVRVHSLGKESGVPKWRQAARMVRLLWRLTPSDGAVFCHMSPVFAVVAWPFAVLRRARVVLWYLHRSDTLKLRLALMLSRHLVTADAESLRVRSPKIISVGHGIETARWAASHTPLGGRALRILAVGRLSPIKDYETLIRAASKLRDGTIAPEVRIVGRPVMQGDTAYAGLLSTLSRRLGVQDTVSLYGFVPHHAIAPHYAWADVIYGGTPTGGLDKALLEGMAAGCVPVTSNSAMGETLGAHAATLLFRHGDHVTLSGILERLNLEPLRDDMAASVRSRHELSATVARIVSLMNP